MTEKFYMVWCPNKFPPAKKHHFQQIALDEAVRLARKHPGEEFFVVEATHRFELPKVQDVNMQIL